MRRLFWTADHCLCAVYVQYGNEKQVLICDPWQNRTYNYLFKKPCPTQEYKYKKRSNLISYNQCIYPVLSTFKCPSSMTHELCSEYDYGQEKVVLFCKSKKVCYDTREAYKFNICNASESVWNLAMKHFIQFIQKNKNELEKCKDKSLLCEIRIGNEQDIQYLAKCCSSKIDVSIDIIKTSSDYKIHDYGSYCKTHLSNCLDITKRQDGQGKTRLYCKVRDPRKVYMQTPDMGDRSIINHNAIKSIATQPALKVIVPRIDKARTYFADQLKQNQIKIHYYIGNQGILKMWQYQNIFVCFRMVRLFNKNHLQ